MPEPDLMESRAVDPVRLAERRKALGLSQRALAAKAGVSQALIAELERGKHHGTPRSVTRLAAALEVDASDLFALEAQ